MKKKNSIFTILLDVRYPAKLMAVYPVAGNPVQPSFFSFYLKRWVSNSYQRNAQESEADSERKILICNYPLYHLVCTIQMYNYYVQLYKCTMNNAQIFPNLFQEKNIDLLYKRISGYPASRYPANNFARYPNKTESGTTLHISFYGFDY